VTPFRAGASRPAQTIEDCAQVVTLLGRFLADEGQIERDEASLFVAGVT